MPGVILSNLPVLSNLLWYFILGNTIIFTNPDFKEEEIEAQKT